MKLQGKKIGLGITGSFCSFSKVPLIINALQAEGAEVIPILSSKVQRYDTRFNKSSEFIKSIEELTGNTSIKNIVEAEPVGPKKLADAMLIAPCTGNTLAKLAYAITDDTVPMATKSLLRNGYPVVLGIATNDGFGGSAKNIGLLLNTKNYYFVPFSQDAPLAKPNSLVFHHDLVVDTLVAAFEGKQLQPLVLGSPT
ncbi:MAG: dipicolinate synthase subunit B [Clostridia bacterium]|nr:dipicolinate synthase subunit B [Clostridia bacterium]